MDSAFHLEISPTLHQSPHTDPNLLHVAKVPVCKCPLPLRGCRGEPHSRASTFQMGISQHGLSSKQPGVKVANPDFSDHARIMWEIFKRKSGDFYFSSHGDFKVGKHSDNTHVKLLTEIFGF